MTEYEVFKAHRAAEVPGWLVRSTDDSGELHETYFTGPLAEARARVYAERMNEIHSKHISWPHE